MIEKLASTYYRLQSLTIDRVKPLDGLGPLALRLFLAPIFWMGGINKLNSFDSIVGWFGPGGLDLPLPMLMASLATGTEILGAILLVAGLATRWITIPLMVTMVVAIFTVHIDNGWAAIASSADSEIASRVGAARGLLEQYGNYDWLTAKGSFVILQNGIEFAVTYFIMLFSLFFTGGGRFFSMDYYLDRAFNPTSQQQAE